MSRTRPARPRPITVRSSAALAVAAALAAPIGLGIAPAATATPVGVTSTSERVAQAETFSGRTLELVVNDDTGDVRARVIGAQPGDAVWLDRSVNGFNSHTQLGLTDEPTEGVLTTAQFSDRVGNNIALFLGCMDIDPDTAGGVHCLSQADRSSSGDALAAANGFAHYYSTSSKIFDHDPTGTQPTQWLKWWHSAVATSALVGSAAATGDERHLALVDDIYEDNKNKDSHGLGNQFRNDFIDDTGWWAMAWIDAYRSTHDAKYLNTAKVAADFMAQWWNTDNACGGLYWKLEQVGGQWRGINHLSAISNSLYLQVNSALFRETGEAKYLERAAQEWDWFSGSGMIDSDGLVRDGVSKSTCTAGGGKYTYNQGVLISGLVEYYQVTGDASLLTTARTVADALTTSSTYSRDGILRDTCENNHLPSLTSNPFGYRCGNDGPVFKGPTVRGLAELSAVLPDKPYADYLRNQIDSAKQVGSRQAQVRQGADIYGLRWFDGATLPNPDTDPDNANRLHIGNQVAGAMLANANAHRSPSGSAQAKLTTSPAAPGAAGWFNRAVTVTATAQPAGPLELLRNGTWSPYTAPVTFSDGVHAVGARPTNGGAVTGKVLRIDTTAPAVTASVPEFQRTVTLSATDAGSGVESIEYRIGSGSWREYTAPFAVPITEGTVDYRATDAAGNSSSARTYAFGPAIDSRLTVTTKGAAAGARPRVTVTARAVGYSVTPTGIVQVKRNGNLIGSAALTSGRAIIDLPTNLGVGQHPVQIVYLGSPAIHSASAGAVVRVTKSGATAKTTAKKTVRTKQRATVRVTVKSATGIRATGRVTVKVSAKGKRTLTRRAKVAKNGRATIRLPRLAAGKYTVRASYAGSANVAKTSAKAARITVRR